MSKSWERERRNVSVTREACLMVSYGLRRLLDERNVKLPRNTRRRLARLRNKFLNEVDGR